MQEKVLEVNPEPIAGLGRQRDPAPQPVYGVPGWLRLSTGKQPARKERVREDERARVLEELRHRSNMAQLGVEVNELHVPGIRL